MRSFAFATVFAAANAISQIELEYMNYLAQYGKQLSEIAEFNACKELYAAADAFIREHNSSE